MVARRFDRFDQLANFPIEIAALDRQFGQIKGRVGGSGVVEFGGEMSGDLAKTAVVQFALPAAADQ